MAWSSAIAGISPTKGFEVNGLGLLSGYGSIEITAFPPATSVIVPVVTGVPSITAYPSYTHPSGNVGKLKPVAGIPEERSKNQIPLVSFVMVPSVGVARIYFPFADEKSPTIAVVTAAVNSCIYVDIEF